MRVLKSMAIGCTGLCVILLGVGTAAAQSSAKGRVGSSPFTWTGFYFGVQAGEGFDRGSVNIPAYPFPNHVQDGQGVLGGVELGYNYQYQKFVFGVEGDLSESGVNSTARSGNGGTELYNINESWRAGLRGRLGLALGETLVYGTAGGAWTNYTTQYIPLAGGVQTATAAGWAAGGGIEHVLLRGPGSMAVTGRVEYLYSDLGTSHFVHLGPSNVGYQTQEVLAGIGVKF